MRQFLLAVALSAAAFLASPAQAFCGFYAGKADASLFNEASQVIVARDGRRTVLSMLNDYQGPLSEFALVVPTPTVLQKGQVRVADRQVFERLDAYSAPRLAEYHDGDPCRVDFRWGDDFSPHRPELSMRMPAPAAAAPRALNEKARDQALGVTVEVQYTLDEYDIVSLSALQSDGLETWLRENGYRIPAGASAALRPYIQQGMKFFVAKVNLTEQARLGFRTLRPLQFAFESEKFMLPMRLGMLNAPPGKPQELIVYLLTREGRVESSNYRTTRLPTHLNLPPAVKPKFGAFYQAMFARQAEQGGNRLVFTEYFWDMGWCDPCAATPLSTEELRKAGAFWVGGGSAEQNFGALLQGQGAAGRQLVPPGGAQPAMLTRLHLRYTPPTFPEDLMFTQTRDRQNWQVRYVIQNPYPGTVAQCSEQVGAMDCEAMCRPRVAQVLQWAPGRDRSGASVPGAVRDHDALVLQRQCVAACQASKREGLAAAARYYDQELPARLQREKQVLAQLTGWSSGEIDALAGSFSPAADRAGEGSWWRKLFGTP